MVYKSFYMKNTDKKRGFTLTEILVVIFIIGFISSIMIVNWRSNEERYKLHRIAQEVVQDIRSAQDMALTSFRYEGNIPSAYGVYFDKQDSRGYIIFGDLNENGRYNSNGDIVVEGVEISEGVEIYDLSNDLHVLFSIPDGFTQIYPTNPFARVTLKRTNGSCPDDCLDIVVRSTGRVSIE
ncbi:MAG: prepilin-type N-terminal cleavage/methylation domain-containing protein [Candidatus Portnoybacteria bacterium]|nr:prepilin-type N-terminal cleavage/methylation domain-containing protein [Candidatus Portnoybacteria bacterium]